MARLTIPLPFHWIAWPMVAILFPAIVYLSWAHARPRVTEETRAWTVQGPPCPELEAAAFSRLPPSPNPEHSFAYADETFTRRNGAVACDRLVDDGGRGFARHTVCQFSGPDTLVVQAPDAVHRYVTGVHPATIVVEHGRISCVLGAHFKPGGWPEESPS